MKTKYRVGSVLLALALIFSLSLTAFAADVSTIDPAQTGSITLFKYDLTTATAKLTENGQDMPSWTSNGTRNEAAEQVLADYAIEGVEFSYLKVSDIIDLTTVEKDGKATVALLYGFRDLAFVQTLGLTADDAFRTVDGVRYYRSDDLQQALLTLEQDSTTAKNTLEAYITANGGTAMTETDENGMSKATGLPVGLYLMAETRVPENVTSTVNPYLVSVPTTVNGTTWQYDVFAYPKNETGNPTLEKTVRESQKDTGKTADFTHTATASIGDVVEYQIVSKLPTITSNATALTTYTYLDTLSKGITYNKQDVTIRFCTDAENTVATWTEADGKFDVTYGSGADGATTMTIAMTAAGLQEINSSAAVYTDGVQRGYSGCYMVINYAATVNADAVLGDTGNPNEVTLTWKRTNTSYYDTLRDDCHVYTYGMALTKEFVDTDGNFADVKFLMENKTDGYFVTAERKDDVYTVTGHVADKKDATVFTPDKNGKITVRGMEDDKYELTEIATTNGYQLLAKPVVVEISQQESETHCPICGKALLTASAKVNDKDVTMLKDGESVNAVVPLTVLNTHTTVFPPTGESGNLWLSVLGLCGMVACGAIIVLLKKHTA